MIPFSGNRALLQAFLVDAERYLGDFSNALEPAPDSADNAWGTALEALRGIRIGAEFLQVAPLSELCRRLENSLVLLQGRPVPVEVLQALKRGAEEISAQLGELGAFDASPTAVKETANNSYQPPEEMTSISEVETQARVPEPSAIRVEAMEVAETLPPVEVADDSMPIVTRDSPKAEEDAITQASNDAAPPPPQAGANPPVEDHEDTAQLAQMFQEWMGEWRAFRAQIESLYPGPAPAGLVLSGEASTAGAGEGNTVLAASSCADSANIEHPPPAEKAEAGTKPKASIRRVGPESLTVLKLSIGNALYALPASKVLGFVEPRRDAMRLSAGTTLAALEQAAVPVVDLGQRWKLGERTPEARIVLVENGSRRLGLWADRVHGSENLRMQPLLPRACYPDALAGAALSGQGEVVLLLRPEAIADTAAVA